MKKKKTRKKAGTDIAYQNKDVAFKMTGEVLEGKSQEDMAEDLEEGAEVIREICQAIFLCEEPFDSKKVLRLWKKNKTSAVSR